VSDNPANPGVLDKNKQEKKHMESREEVKEAENEVVKVVKEEEDKESLEEKERSREEKKKEEEEEKVIEEKTVTINLRHAYLAHGRKAAPRAIKLVKKISQRIADSEEVKIDNDLNALLWSRGKTKTLRRVSIKVQKLEDGTARVLPAGA